MRMREYTRLWFRSAFGPGTIFLALAAGLGAALFLGPALGGGIIAATLVGLLAGGAAFGLLFGACLATGAGSKAAFSEMARDEARRNGERHGSMADDRRRLASMRIADEGVAAARDLVVLQAGRFLEGARAAGGEAWEPAAAAALAEAIDVVDAWLHEADETAIERRFQTGDAHPFPDARERVITLLKEKALAVAAGLDAVAGPTPPERVAIDEETR